MVFGIAFFFSLLVAGDHQTTRNFQQITCLALRGGLYDLLPVVLVTGMVGCWSSGISVIIISTLLAGLWVGGGSLLFRRFIIMPYPYL